MTVRGLATRSLEPGRDCRSVAVVAQLGFSHSIVGVRILIWRLPLGASGTPRETEGDP